MILMDIDPNISLVDSKHFLGTEKVEVKIKTHADKQFSITKNFVVSEIVAQQKGGDGNELIALDLVEDCAYLSSLMRISKSFKGRKEDIIGKIINAIDRELLLPQDLDITGDKWFYVFFSISSSLGPSFFRSILVVIILWGVSAATFSMSTPPSILLIKAIFEDSRSIKHER